MRSRFDEQLAQLNREMIEMGAQCEEVIALASKALTEADMKLAAKVAPLSADIDRKEREIEALCLRLLLQQQPVARDLRQISAALKMITVSEIRPRRSPISSALSTGTTPRTMSPSPKWPRPQYTWSRKALTLT